MSREPATDDMQFLRQPNLQGMHHVLGAWRTNSGPQFGRIADYWASQHVSEVNQYLEGNPLRGGGKTTL